MATVDNCFICFVFPENSLYTQINSHFFSNLRGQQIHAHTDIFTFHEDLKPLSMFRQCQKKASILHAKTVLKFMEH